MDTMSSQGRRMFRNAVLKRVFGTSLVIVAVVSLTSRAWPQTTEPIHFGFDDPTDLFTCQSGDSTSLDPSGPLPGVSSMRWDIAYRPGELRECQRGFPREQFQEAQGMRFHITSSKLGVVLLRLEENTGEHYWAAVPVGNEWAEVSLTLADFQVNASTKKDGVLEFDKVEKVALVDAGGLVGQTGTGTTRVAEWFIEPLPFTSRPYHMGFIRALPVLPVAPPPASVNAMDAFIATNGKLVAHHLETGIPWQEALENGPFPASVMDVWNEAKSKTLPGYQVYVAVNPLDLLTRTHLAPGPGESWIAGRLPPSPWDTLPLNHSDVKTAYLNYVQRVIDFFDPNYLAIGVEVNILLAMNPNPSAWQEYLDLQRYVYTELKRTHPNLPIFVSNLYHLLQIPEVQQAQVTAITELMSWSDLLALSIQPQANAYQGGPFYPLPDNYFDAALTFGKPIAVTETGYPSRGYTTNGNSFQYSQRDQYKFVELLLRKANEYNFVFLVLVTGIDFSQLMQTWPQSFKDLLIPFAYTGLKTEGGTIKPSLSIWDAYFDLPKR